MKQILFDYFTMNVLESYKPMLIILLFFGLISFKLTKNKIVQCTKILLLQNLIGFVIFIIFQIYTLYAFYKDNYLNNSAGKTNKYAVIIQITSQFIFHTLLIIFTLLRRIEHCKLLNEIILFDGKFQNYNIKFFGHDRRQNRRFFLKLLIVVCVLSVLWIIEFCDNFITSMDLFYICISLNLISFILISYHMENIALMIIIRCESIRKFIKNENNDNLQRRILFLLAKEFCKLKNYFCIAFSESIIIILMSHLFSMTVNCYNYYIKTYMGLIKNSSLWNHLRVIFTYIGIYFVVIFQFVRALHILGQQVTYFTYS